MTDFENTTEYRAIGLLYKLLAAHVNMVTHPVEFSKDNPTKQHYFGLLNRTIDLIQLGLEHSDMPWEVLRPIENEEAPGLECQRDMDEWNYRLAEEEGASEDE